MIKRYGAYTNHSFISMCEEETKFVNKMFNVCSFYLNNDNILNLIKELNDIINNLAYISKITDINIKIYTTININLISSAINTENVIQVKSVIELLEKMDYNLYYKIAKKLNILDKNEEENIIKKIDFNISKFYSKNIRNIINNKTIF